MSPPATYRERWIAWVLRHATAVLVGAAALTAVAAYLASQLHVDTDLRRLLPPDHPVVRSLEDFERSFGSTGSVNVVVKGGNRAERHAYADALAAEMDGDPRIDTVDYRLPSRFFVEHALYYLDEGRMARLRKLVAAWSHYEFCSAARDVCVDEPDPKAPARLREFIEQERTRSFQRTGFQDYYERDGIDALVLLLRPVRPSSDLAFARDVVAGVRGKVAAVLARDGPWRDADLAVNVVGPYVVKAEGHATIRRDMVRSGLVAAVGVVTILYLLFRSVRAVLVLLLPLTCGVTWAMGATQLLLGHLNSMTSLISTVVMGMGIDAGIHFYARIRRLRRAHRTPEAIRLAFCGLIVPLLVASATTMGAFVVMALSAFPVFREFGIIAAAGVVSCLLSMITVLPALCVRVGVRVPAGPDRAGARAAARLLRRPGPWFAVVVLATVASFQGLRHVHFEYDGRRLQSDRARAATEADTHLISRIFGKDIHAGVWVVPDLPTARRALARARVRHAQRVQAGTSVVAQLFGPPDLLPPAEVDLALREREIRQLAQDVPDTAFRRLYEVAELPVPPELADRLAGTGDGSGGDWGIAEEDDAPFGGAEPVPRPAEAAFPPRKGAPPAQPETTGPARIPPVSTEAAAGSTPPPLHGPRAGIIEAGGPAPHGAGADAVSAGKEGGSQGTAPAGEPMELTKEDARLLLRMLEAEPFVPSDLPAVVWKKVAAPDGRLGIFAYPAFDAANIREGVRFMEETQDYVADPRRDRFVGETTVYAAMYLALLEESPVVLGMAGVLVAALVFWQVRQVGWTLLTLMPLALGLWWMVGLQGALDVRWTLFNLPILPAILGIGVDNGVYLTDRLRRARREGSDLAQQVGETAGAILAATATTLVGFAAFLVADSGGLRSIGSLSVVAISMVAAAAVIGLPTVVGLATRRPAARPHDSGGTSPG